MQASGLMDVRELLARQVVQALGVMVCQVEVCNKVF